MKKVRAVVHGLNRVLSRDAKTYKISMVIEDKKENIKVYYQKYRSFIYIDIFVSDKKEYSVETGDYGDLDMENADLKFKNSVLHIDIPIIQPKQMEIK